MCRCVTCAISCASTPASSLSLRVAISRPEFTPMNPPGSAKALIAGSLDHEEVEGPVAVLVRLARRARSPSDCRYSVISGSSTIWPAFAQPAHRPCGRCWYSSSSAERRAAPRVPMSGSSFLAGACCAASGTGSTSRARPADPAAGRTSGASERRCIAVWTRSRHVAGSASQSVSDAKSASRERSPRIKRDVPGMLPAAEAVDDVGQARRWSRSGRACRSARCCRGTRAWCPGPARVTSAFICLGVRFCASSRIR